MVGVKVLQSNPRILVERLGRYRELCNSSDEITKEIYLINNVVMEVTLSPGESAMSVNDSAVISLIGRKSNVNQMERIIRDLKVHGFK